MVNVYLYSSVRNFVIVGTDEHGENCYMTNNSQFTVGEKLVRCKRSSELMLFIEMCI